MLLRRSSAAAAHKAMRYNLAAAGAKPVLAIRSL